MVKMDLEDIWRKLDDILKCLERIEQLLYTWLVPTSFTASYTYEPEHPKDITSKGEDFNGV